MSFKAQSVETAVNEWVALVESRGNVVTGNMVIIFRQGYQAALDGMDNYIQDSDELRLEYRAVFSYPDSILGESQDTYGPPRNSAEETAADSPYRPEETHGWRNGTQRRTVTDWELLSDTPS